MPYDDFYEARKQGERNGYTGGSRWANPHVNGDHDNPDLSHAWEIGQRAGEKRRRELIEDGEGGLHD
jgi:hypothetical protein